MSSIFKVGCCQIRSVRSYNMYFKLKMPFPDLLRRHESSLACLRGSPCSCLEVGQMHFDPTLEKFHLQCGSTCLNWHCETQISRNVCRLQVSVENCEGINLGDAMLIMAQIDPNLKSTENISLKQLKEEHFLYFLFCSTGASLYEVELEIQTFFSPSYKWYVM